MLQTVKCHAHQGCPVVIPSQFSPSSRAPSPWRGLSQAQRPPFLSLDHAAFPQAQSFPPDRLMCWRHPP